MTSVLDDLNIEFSDATTRNWQPGSEAARDIAVLMSGGVDSSVTAMLLRDAGWNVVGVTLHIPIAGGSGQAPKEAVEVADSLGLAHYYLDVREAFERLVIEPFRRSYEHGRTPCPCADCNMLFKFGMVWDAIKEHFAVENLATGHYARVLRDGEQAYLVRGDDHSRDQSYFLYGIQKYRLKHLYLPLGDFGKDEVRQLAAKSGLPVAHRDDSMELCFASGDDYRTALGLPSETGPILDMDGKVIGEHKGIANYTIGQRKGIGIAAAMPFHVISIDPINNTITVATREQALSSTVEAHEINILIPEQMSPNSRFCGKIRSQGEPSPCVLTQIGESTMSVRFDQPQFAPTPGQRLVLYDSDSRVVAGGVICSGCIKSEDK